MDEGDAGEGISWTSGSGNTIYGKMRSDLCASGTFRNMLAITFLIPGQKGNIRCDGKDCLHLAAEPLDFFDDV